MRAPARGVNYKPAPLKNGFGTKCMFSKIWVFCANSFQSFLRPQRVHYITHFLFCQLIQYNNAFFLVLLPYFCGQLA